MLQLGTQKNREMMSVLFAKKRTMEMVKFDKEEDDDSAEEKYYNGRGVEDNAKLVV